MNCTYLCLGEDELYVFMPSLAEMTIIIKRDHMTLSDPK